MKKYIVYMENSFCLIGKEFFIQDGAKVITTHNPRHATLFNTKNDAQAFCDSIDLDNLNICLPDKHYKAFDECTYVYRNITPIDKVHSRRYANETPLEVLEWWKKTNTIPEKATSSEIYSTWPKLYSVFSHLHSILKFRMAVIDLDHSKRKSSVHTNKKYTYSLQISVGKTDEFAGFKYELDLVLDFVTHIKDGYKVFSIFEHTLSKFGSYNLLYKSDDDCKIIGTYATVQEGTLM